MTTVTVTPAEFNMVDFDGERIAAIVEKLVGDVGLDSSTEVRIEVDETSPLGRSKLKSEDPVSIWAESGAFEDPKRPRQLSDAATADVIGRLLLKLRDRQDADFGAPDTDDDVDIAYRTAWDIYAMGRLNRLGYRGQRQRRLYHWRNRCGFTDVADEAFEEIWTGDGLTYADLVERVDRSKAVRPEPAAT